MGTEIIVNKTGRESRLAILEAGRLAELLIDRGDNRGFVGNVYLGRVVRVLPGMQAAFVDIGLERAAFLYVGDIYTDFLHMHEDPATAESDTAEVPRSRGSSRSNQPPIQDLLSEGQNIVVQVAKDPIGTKGARLTTHIAMPGRYVVFMPTVEHVGISRRIERDRERRRLRDLVERTRPKGAGFIVRTVCEGQPEDVLSADMTFLLKTWERIQGAAREKKAPALLHEDYGLVLRAVRDMVDGELDRMVVDDKELFDEVKSFMSDFMPQLKDKVHLYRGKEPTFDNYNVEVQIKRSLGRKVWLKSGGYLVIDQTEALMAIDVNSGKFVGTSSLEETTLMTNLEAAQEVVHQLRLRNMGGIIIIDFIDMEKEASRAKVTAALEEALQADRARTNVLRISDLGLVEMTRKRVQEGLDRYLTESCPTCEGTGVLRSRATLCFDILREVQREANRKKEAPAIYVNTTPEIADMFYGPRFADLEATEETLGRRIIVRALGHYHPEQYEVYAR
ncbi:MAG: Rne/Rng family ribonuclease [Deltaproteobacteria bacterium]|nr:MAG: Rne/Rng family ribonuclease [Deltaproteobacteria bacterium]